MVKLCVLFLASMVAYTYAAVALFPPEPKPAEFAHLSGCYLKSLNRVLPYNEPYYPKDNKSCVQYTCGKDNYTQLVSCGVVGLPEECHLEHDYTLDYPKCCGTPVCLTTTTTTTTEEPCITVTEPSTTTEQPCITVTEPSTTTEQPCITVTEPSTTTEETCVTRTEPTTTTEDSCVTVKPPCH